MSAADILRARLSQGVVREHEPFARHTTFGIGGPADVMVWPADGDELAAVLATCSEHDWPMFILGNGSNLLVSDAGMEGVVIVTEQLNAVTFEGDDVRAECGVLLADLSTAAAVRGLSGLEFACGIPGSVGGAVYMNAGAYDGEMKDVLTAVEVVDRYGERRTIPAAEMELAYRHSRLKNEFLVCIAAHLTLAPGNRDEINSTIAELTERRESRQPLELPSAGSTFKRPPGRYAGPLIIECGLQGHQIGGAQISMKHAGFIVNQGGATARDVLDLIDHVQTEVAAQTGIALEPEVRMVGRPMPERTPQPE